MEDKKQYSMMIADRVAPVQNDHKRRNFLKGIAIFFLVFAPFLGWCELTGDGNNSLAASKADPMLSKAQNSGLESPGSVKTETATFAGGCFWCTQADFEKLPGVVKVVAGYSGGQKQNPTYEEVSSGSTGHVEAVQVYYDPSKVTYEELLDYFWRHVDPTDAGGQFVDRGSQYRSVIFYHNEEQKLVAEKSKEDAEQIREVRQAHRDGDYQIYQVLRGGGLSPGLLQEESLAVQVLSLRVRPRPVPGKGMGKGRPKSAKAANEQAYKKPDDATLRKNLTPMQYEVTQKEGTEPPFRNEYWDNHREGIYVDIVSGEPLFSSKDKYESGTGWPSFTKPLEPGNIVEKEDHQLFHDAHRSQE